VRRSTTPQLQLQGVEALSEADQLAMFTTLGALLNGFQQRNADALDDVYSDDADWVNAFGSVKHGRAEIVDYLRGLFADDNFNDGQLVAPPRSTIRRISDDVVTVSTHLQIRGQGLAGGGQIELRDNHSLRVLARRPDGTWRVVSEMYMDARTEQTYADRNGIKVGNTVRRQGRTIGAGHKGGIR
jgi:uncharacterized protein (TIGR02246 family)